MSILYCDCFSGISGDMFLASLLDAGLPKDQLQAMLRRLDLPEFESMDVRKVRRGPLEATLLEFRIRGDEHTHHHSDEHKRHHGHEHEHHDDENAHHHDGPPQRNLGDIVQLIERSGLPDPVQRTARAIFQKLAQAEAKVHGSSVEEVHFHEVGATDSILDIVGAAAALHILGVDRVYSSPLPLGTGTVQTQHGLLPLPVPATLELLQVAHAPVVPSTATKEMVTPTGAAILATLAKFEQPSMTLQRAGTGAGQREMEWPNVLRVMIGAPSEAVDSHVELETNIDDMNPQLFSPTMARLFAAGALDVFLTPIYMKKNRPATRISVIARHQDEEKLAKILLKETTTLGVRARGLRRYEAGREMRRVQTRWGEVAVKVKILDGFFMQATPEFDDCARLSEANGVPVSSVIQEAQALASSQLRRDLD